MSVCSYVLKGCGFDHKSCLAELVDDSLRACQVSGSEDKQQREALHYHPVLRTPLLPRKRGLRWVWLPSFRRGRGRPPKKKMAGHERIERGCCGRPGEGGGGAGGSRTHVRTRKSYAFYTLIPDFIFERRQDLDHQPAPYPLKLHRCVEAHNDYFRFSCAAGSSDSEQHPWGDVSFPHLVKELSS